MFARTPRLFLRPGWAEDAPALAAAIGEEAIVRNLASVPWPYDVSQARAYIAAWPDKRLPGFLVFARTDATPVLIGGCGLGEAPDGGTELGYWIARTHWGRGYATEAGRAVLEIASTLGIRHLVAGHFVDNPASGRVLAKLGFRATGRTAPCHSRARGGEALSALYALDDGGADARMAA